MRLLEEAGAPPVVAFSAEDAVDAQVGLAAAAFTWRGLRVLLPVGGHVNVMNALATATTAAALGVPGSAIREGLATLPPVPGRMETIEAGQPFDVIVDYAHTPDGLERVLGTARSARPGGRLAVVFGCGGERDAGKRPLMGAAAARLADLVVITNDNPRTEDATEIIEQVRAGAAAGSAVVEIEPDRRQAIRRAVEWARPGDVVVVAGKGHETGQQIGTDVFPFDDRLVAREVLGPVDGGPSQGGLDGGVPA